MINNDKKLQRFIVRLFNKKRSIRSVLRDMAFDNKFIN